jgi:hypothetical protein
LVLSCADLTFNLLAVPSQLSNLSPDTQHIEPERSRRIPPETEIPRRDIPTHEVTHIPL